MVLDIATNKIILYSKGNIIYKDMNLTDRLLKWTRNSKM